MTNPTLDAPRATHVAVDPGIEGAIAWLDEAGQRRVRDLPVRVVELKSRTPAGAPRRRRVTDVAELARVVRDEVRPAPGCELLVEALAPSFHRGRKATGGREQSVSAATASVQGANYGRVLGVLGALLGRVPPVASARAWRSSHGLAGRDQEERKAQAVARACALLPELEPVIRVAPTGRQRKTQVKDGRADALLLLLYLEASTRRAPGPRPRPATR